MEAPAEKKKAAGAPLWLATFADLMSLLMCFFVLLLSFSEMDVVKYKQVAGSMAQAFGVQKEITAYDTPMGTSYVAREFSPGRPMPTEKLIIQQQASQIAPNMDVEQTQRARKLQAVAGKIRAGLKEEMEKGLVTVEVEEDRIVIRVQEKGSFPSGQAVLMESIRPAMAKIGTILAETDGEVVVGGHTDNVPINTPRFRSNWDLSASRAVTVVQELLAASPLPQERLRAEGYGEYQPIRPNDSAADRALNRRIEITLRQTPTQATRAPLNMDPDGDDALAEQPTDTGAP